jgi:diguanylate cyclase (GGDEF)-like protein
LQGFEKNWSEWTVKNEKEYTNLPGGDYTFLVKSRNSFGNIGSTASFQFVIQIHWSKTLWAYIIFILLIVVTFTLSSLGIFKFRLKQVKKREEQILGLVAQKTKDLIRINLELAQTNEFKSQLLSMVAHDLRNPLQIIYGYSEILKLKMKQNDDQKKVNLILQTAGEMMKIIEDTLNLASIDENKIKIKSEEIHLSMLARTIADAFFYIALRKEQHLEISIQDHLYIQGDNQRIRAIIENLISNAIKYTQIGGNIDFIVKKEEETAKIIVRDNGQGISQEDQKKLFTEFQRLSSKPTAGEPSTGLGLYIVKKLVGLHKGTIAVESHLNQGSSFEVSLPLSATLSAKMLQSQIVETRLTIKNYQGCLEHLGSKWKSKVRQSKPVTLLLIEIDNFNVFISDHDPDKVFIYKQRFAHIIFNTVNRSNDLIAEFEQHRYAVVLNDTGLKGALVVAERIRKQIEDLKLFHDNLQNQEKYLLTASIGVCTIIPSKKNSLAELLKGAEETLQVSRQKGGNAINAKELSVQ